MSPVIFGTLSTLPLAVFFAIRNARLRARMDTRAARRLLFRSALFLAGCALGSALLYAGAGTVPLPLAWTILLILVGIAVLLGVLKRS